MSIVGTISLPRLSPHYLLGAGFVAYAAASLLWSNASILYPAIYLASLTGCFILGSQIYNIRPLWIGFCICVICLNAFSYLSPWYINPNYTGSFITLALAGAIAYEIWVFIPFAALGLWACRSREAIAVSGILCLIGLWKRSRFLAMLAALGAAFLIVTQKPEIASSLAGRLGVWQDTINHLSFWGHGFGSFLHEYSHFAFRTNAEGQLFPHAYNDFLELIFDLGIGSIFLWTLIIFAWENDNTQAKMIVGTFILMGLTYFPFWIEGLAQIFAFTLGHLANSDNNRRIIWPLRSV